MAWIRSYRLLHFLLTRLDSEAECPSRDCLRSATALLVSFFGCWVGWTRSATSSGVLSVWSTAPALLGDSFRGPARVVPTNFTDYNINNNSSLTIILPHGTYIATSKRCAKLKDISTVESGIIVGCIANKLSVVAISIYHSSVAVIFTRQGKALKLESASRSTKNPLSLIYLLSTWSRMIQCYTLSFLPVSRDNGFDSSQGSQHRCVLSNNVQLSLVIITWFNN